MKTVKVKVTRTVRRQGVGVTTATKVSVTVSDGVNTVLVEDFALGKGGVLAAKQRCRSRASELLRELLGEDS